MAELEALTLNGLALHSGNFTLEALDMTPPKKKPEWAQSSDADGADLIRTPLFENRTITASIRIGPMATMDEALAKLGELTDQLQEAEKNPGGIALEWTPAKSTKTITFYVLTAEVTSIPIVVEGSGVGYLAAAPLVTVAFTCKPFGYGAEVEGAAAKSIETGLSVVVLTVPSVAGDVPAEGRLVIKDTAAIGRRFVEWGLENRYYNSETKLVLDSEDMTPVGGAQSTALNSSGAYKRAGATKGTIATTLFGSPTLCCSTGNLGHVGTFRIKARIYASLATSSLLQNISVRLSWQDGQGPFRANAWQTPVTAGAFSEVDLGVVTVTPAQAGTQRWVGHIEAFSSNEESDTLHVDYLTLIPVLEGYGKARGVRPASFGAALVAYEQFTTGTLSGSLNGRTAPLGGNWATSGAATDFTVHPAEANVAPGNASRATTSDAGARYALLGGSLINTETSAIFSGGPLGSEHGLIARWTNSSNFLALTALQTAGSVNVQLVTVIAGSATIIAAKPIYGSFSNISLVSTLTMIVLADGSVGAEVVVGNFGTASLSATNSALATGGTLASGKDGIFDINSTATAGTRRLRKFWASELSAIPFCVQPSKTMEVRSDSAIAADSAGTYFGPVPEYRGSRFYVPQDGEANRTSRIIVKADRNDLQEGDQQTIADTFTAQPFVTPRYHVIPR
jgi:hypothetical protein